MNQSASLNGADPMTTRPAIGPEGFESTDRLTIDKPCEDCQNTGYLGGGNSGAVCTCYHGNCVRLRVRQVIRQSTRYGDSIPKGVA